MCLLTFTNYSNQGLPKTQGTQGNAGYFLILEVLKLNVKKHICFEANQGGDSPILPPEKPKPQHEINTL